MSKTTSTCVLLILVLSLALGHATVGAQTTDHSQHQQQQPPAAAIDQPHARAASGTSWQPDSSPMYAVHRQHGDWDLLFHGNAFVQYLNEGGQRGEDQFGSINWAMGMASRMLEDRRLILRGMISLEPLTIGGCGYPDLLASGEVCEGHAIVDRQHPHDLFMEVAAQYDVPIAQTIGLQLYAGLAGEPALGPVAFPHRISAMLNPIAPLSHHWLDSTHVSFGVLTGGVYARRWKLEGSVFNGREPDEGRYDFDLGAFDSFSGRVWYLPNENLSLQVSAGHLAEAEEVDALTRVDVDRVTASATYNRPLRDGSSWWGSTVAWGRNTEQSLTTTQFLLAETHVSFDEQDTWYGRLEIGRKTAHDLEIPGVLPDQLFTLSKAQAGYTRYFDPWHGLKPGAGVSLSMSLVPSALDMVYGNRASFGLGLYVTLRPAAMRMP